jgi:hypothetical protein
LCGRAAQFNNLEEAARIYSDAMEIDQRNKGTNAKILASRAEVYAKVEHKDSLELSALKYDFLTFW